MSVFSEVLKRLEDAVEPYSAARRGQGAFKAAVSVGDIVELLRQFRISDDGCRALYERTNRAEEEKAAVVAEHNRLMKDRNEMLQDALRYRHVRQYTIARINRLGGQDLDEAVDESMAYYEPSAYAAMKASA